MEKNVVKILQFGEGNFLRAFVDSMVCHANAAGVFAGGACVCNLRRSGSVEKIKNAGGVYNLISRGMQNGAAVSEITKIDSIIDAVNPYSEFEKFVSFAESETLRFIVSNSTEAGIRFSAADSLSDTPPETFPAKLALLLYKRWRHFGGDTAKGLIILPCELLERNGDALKECVLKYAELWKLEAEFTAWLCAACVFCNTLVDRIVSGHPSDDEKDPAVRALNDPISVVAEPYLLWAIQPKSVAAELPLDKCGLNVIFCDDIAPYRSRKVTLLNAPHTAMTAVGLLSGMQTVREAVEDPLVGKFVRGLMFEELVPTLALPQAESEAFAADVIDRFRNPFLEHKLKSIALNFVSKCNVRLVPPAEKYFEKFGKVPRRLAFAFAANILMTFADKSALGDSPEAAQTASKPTPEAFAEAFVSSPRFVGGLSENAEFKNAVVCFVKKIGERGIAGALGDFENGKSA